MLKEQFELDKFRLVHDEPKDFSTCCWQKTTQIKLGWIAYRTIFLGILLSCLLYVIIFWVTQEDLTSEDRPKLLIYLTYWTFFLESFLFFWGFLVAVVDYVKQRRGTDDGKLSLIAKVYWVVYTVVLPCAVSVTLIFWSLIYDKHFALDASNILLHVFNSIFIVIDFWLVAFPFRFLHFYMPYVYVSVYIVFSLIYELSGGTGPMGTGPIYKIVDWKGKPLLSALFVLLGCFALLIVYIIFSFLYLFKIWLVKKYVQKTG